MSAQAVPSPQSLWQAHVERVLAVLCLALERLAQSHDLPRSEEALDRRLFLLARDAYWRLPSAKRPHSFALVPKAEQAPLEERDVGEEWIGRRPDFKWRMHNDLAGSPAELTMDFDIESKRLGRPTSRNWVLTAQYVANGIVRFLSKQHRYGNGVSSGAMVGYIQDSEPSVLLAEVNRCIAAQPAHRIPRLALPKAGSFGPAVARTRQCLRRTAVHPSEFALYHLWADLRR